MPEGAANPNADPNADPDADARHMADNPAEFFNWSHTAMHSIPPERLAALQCAALRYRFDTLRDRIPVVKKLTDEQGLAEITALDDIVPALLPHTAYKSYPASLLEKSRFAQITAWLGKLTTLDIGNIDVSQCEGIDAWLDVMDEQSPLTILHSSGTSGTMSFLPRSKAEMEKYADTVLIAMFQRFGDPAPAVTPPQWPSIDIVQPGYSRGRNFPLRMTAALRRKLDNPDERYHAVFSGAMSSDLLFLAGRLRAAAARGELDRLELSPHLKARQKEFEQLQAGMAESLPSFFEHVKRDLKGRRVLITGTWNLLYDLARDGLAAGERHLFAADSVIRTGGGAKGQNVPENWQEQAKEFLGVPHITNLYGMSEVMAQNQLCEHGHYHIEPTTILFIIDPDTSAPLPRDGVQTGRGAFFDLLAESMWGGFVTGDELTADWSTPCPCGRTTPYILNRIGRYSDIRGGDDKISCAATPEAHEAALNYLSDFA